MAKKWLQKAINPKHKDRVKNYVRRLYGAKAFTERGTIKPEYLNKAEEHAEKTGNTGLVRATALAKRLKKMH